MAEFWALVDADGGTVETYPTKDEALAALARVLDDEPTWAGDLRVEPSDSDVRPPLDR